MRYEVIISRSDGSKQVATTRWDGAPITSATMAVQVIFGYQEMFPGYQYDWAIIRQTGELQ